MKFSFLKSWFAPWRSYIAEFLGTFVFVLVACGSVLVNIFYGEIGPLGIALASGLAFSAMMFVTSHLSGANLNPAVSLALWLSQKLSSTRLIFYIVFQLLAGFAAAGVLLLVFGAEALKYGLGGPTIGAGVSLSTALVVEAILTAILVLVIFATIVDKQGPVSFGALAVGLIVVAASIFGSAISGAVLNPARGVGPLVLSGSYNDLAVWIVGPAVGSLAGIVYDLLFLRKGKKG